MISIRHYRWLVFFCVVALVSVGCVLVSNLRAGDSELSRQEIPPQLTINTLNSGDPWLLRFPNYWVDEGLCQVDGTKTMLVVRKDDRFEGDLSWIWNDQNGFAHLIGQQSGTAIGLTMEPPDIGGFKITFNGVKSSDSLQSTSIVGEQPHSTSKNSIGKIEVFSGRAKASGICRDHQGDFTLTPVSRLTPSLQTTQLALFRKPFELEFLTTNYFDHDIPRQFQDDNGYMVRWDGEPLKIGSPGAGIDGHAGYDWVVPEGIPLLAVADGIVKFAGQGKSYFCPPLNKQAAGLEVYIDHVGTSNDHSNGNLLSDEHLSGDRFETEYLHLSRVDVAPGQMVKAGQIIGLAGTTGCSTGPHLHFGVFHIGKNNHKTVIDPYGWAAQSSDPWSDNAYGGESMWLWQDDQAPALVEYGR